MCTDGAVRIGDREAAATGSAQAFVVGVIGGYESVIQVAVQSAIVFARARHLARISNGIEQSSQRICGLRGLRPQAFDLASDLIDRSSAQSEEHRPYIGGYGAEIGFDHFRLSGESSSQFLILRGNANRTGVEMTLPRHHTAQGQQR